MEDDIKKALAQFSVNAPIQTSVIQEFERELGGLLPADYVAFLGIADGGEGFVGSSYVILWPLENVLAMNAAYEVRQNAPGLLLFGSNGGGEAYAFDVRQNSFAVVQVPFVGMALDEAFAVSGTFNEFLSVLSSTGTGTARAAHAGKEIFEVKPVKLGGSPTDPTNKVVLDRATHIEAVAYWNRIIRGLKMGTRPS